MFTRRFLLTSLSLSLFWPTFLPNLLEHRQEKATQLLLDRMQQMEDRMEERMTQLQSIQVEQGSQLSRILTAEAKAKEARVQQQQQQQQTPKDPARPASQKQAAEPLLKQPDMPDVLRDQETKEESTSFVVGQKIDAAEGVEEGLKDEDDGELSIPVEHTTAAHKLLMWPSIKSLLYPKEYDEDYVMKLEEGRGLIRVYGRGEGDDTSEGLQPAQQQQQQLPPPPAAAATSSQVAMQHASSHSTPTWDEGYPPSGSPTGAAPWAVAAAAAAAGASTPVASSAASSVKTIDHGLEESGVFTTDPDTVRRLHLSYMDHLHKLHPFLDQNDLEKKLEVFIRVYCPSARPSSASVSFTNNHPGSVGDHPHNHPRGAKRKRSCETLPGAACDLPSPVGGVSSRSYSPRIEQSIDNAIILLVLALGSICECRDRPVPGPISDSPPDFRKEQIPGPSLMHHRPILSPAASESAVPLSSSFYAAPISSSSSSGGGAAGAGNAGGSHSFTSPSMIERQRSLPGQTTAPRDVSTNDTRHLRNMDVIPGLAYYGYATQILGSLQGANGLPHVQAALLAGLYAGQLAHPFQSHGWIYQAARACQVLVRSYVSLPLPSFHLWNQC